MSQIKVITYDRRTEISFSRILNKDFDKILKEAFSSLQILGGDISYLHDTDMSAVYRFSKRLHLPQKQSLEKRLHEIFGLAIPLKEKRKNKDYRKYKTTSFMSVSKKETETICGFIGNLIVDDGKAKFEFLYI
jgi:hypothetical protein